MILIYLFLGIGVILVFMLALSFSRDIGAWGRPDGKAPHFWFWKDLRDSWLDFWHKVK